LLLGRVRDPLVGRDVLVGMALIGSSTMATSWLGSQVAQMLEIPSPLASSFLVPSFAGPRYCCYARSRRCRRRSSFLATVA
jgi:hypothetical protein